MFVKKARTRLLFTFLYESVLSKALFCCLSNKSQLSRETDTCSLPYVCIVLNLYATLEAIQLEIRPLKLARVEDILIRDLFQV